MLSVTFPSSVSRAKALLLVSILACWLPGSAIAWTPADLGAPRRSAASATANLPDADDDGIADAHDLRPGDAEARLSFTGADYTLTILGSGRVANLVVQPAVSDGLAAAQLSTFSTHVPTLTRRLREQFREVFDFIIFIGEANTLPEEAQYAGVSTGSVLSLLHLPEADGLVNGPSLHEIMHRWGNYLESVQTGVNGHWGFSSVGGLLGGWAPGTLQSLGGGRYSAGLAAGRVGFGTGGYASNGLRYAPLELYLMGLIPLREVPDIQIARDASFTANGIFTASSIATVTGAQIVAIDGPRVPDHTVSQRDFHALFVVVTKAPLNNPGWARYDQQAVEFGRAANDGDDFNSNFWEATGGRARMDFSHLEYDTLSYAGPSLIGTSAPPVGESVPYRVTPVPDATAYEWRVTTFPPYTAVEGAEAGLGGMTFVSPFEDDTSDPVGTDFRHSGAAAFRVLILRKLQLKSTLRVSAASELRFYFRRGVALPGQVAQAEISVDDGAWQIIWSREGNGTGDAAFSAAAISLAPYAGRNVRVQFSHALPGSYYPQDQPGFGFYFDDIEVTSAEAPVTSAGTIVASGSFPFQPPQTGEYVLEARARLPGRPLPYGPARTLRTATITFPLTVRATSGRIVREPAQNSYAADDLVSLLAVPDPGFEFAGWSGDVGGAENPLFLTMDRAKDVAAAFTPIPDTDGDGLDDRWEQTHFGGLLTANAASDFDGDGVLDLAEFASGSDPQIAALSIHHPDNALGFGARRLVGDDLHNGSGAGQAVSARLARGKTKTALLAVQNDGAGPNTFLVRGAARGPAFVARYRYKNRDVTREIAAGIFRLRNLPAGGRAVLQVVLTVRKAAPVAAEIVLPITTSWEGDPHLRDVVIYRVTTR